MAGDGAAGADGEAGGEAAAGAGGGGGGRRLLTHTEQAMGTVFSLTVVPGDGPAGGLAAALAAACAVLHRADAVFSTWDPESPVSRLRRGEAPLAALPAEVGEVLAECRAARQASGGWFDPWAMPGGVDPTGLVKGWAVDRALAVLREEGITGALVNGGGDVAAFGSPAPGERWRVGIRHPWRADALAAIVAVTGAVATSGSYERGPHLIDPATGEPSHRAASATVTGPRLALADALATAVAVGGDEALAAVAKLAGYEGYLIRPDGSEADTGGVAFVT
jgi:thiamine biosynthesis lipoprotein